MARIALKNVKPGMQLSKNVCNDSGSMLVNEGEIITEEMLQKLINAHVSYVSVAEKMDEARLEQELSALEIRFAVTGAKPYMDKLKRLLQDHLKELFS